MSKFLVGMVALTFLLSSAGYAQKGGSRSSGSGSSRPSGSSSRPPSSSSRPPSSSSRPPSGGGQTSRPSGGGSMFGGSKPSAGASRPSGSTSQSSNKPSGSMFGGSSKPRNEPTHNPGASNNRTSARPPASGNTTKAAAQHREESRQAYITSQKATAPPRTEAIVGGRTVKVDTSSPAVTQLRNRPSTYIQPTVRRERAFNHITINHYQHPADYYYNRPVSYGIGPYSNGFWWMMMEWDAQRRADWIYNNQSRLSVEAYAAARQDVAVQQRLAALEAQRTPRNTNYVDPEFAADPTDQYDQNYVEAAYNPAVMPVYDSGPGWKSVVVVLLIILVVGTLVWFASTRRWGT
jgi:hypothetical protein